MNLEQIGAALRLYAPDVIIALVILVVAHFAATAI
jgi:hypothetical protein